MERDNSRRFAKKRPPIFVTDTRFEYTKSALSICFHVTIAVLWEQKSWHATCSFTALREAHSLLKADPLIPKRRARGGFLKWPAEIVAKGLDLFT